MSSPIYIQIYKVLKEKIVLGQLKPGDMLMSENELAQQYSTSRPTVRKSLSMLENEGYIYSYPGKGYYVAVPDHNKYTLVFNELHSGDYSINESKLLEVNVIVADEEIARALQVPLQRKVIIIRRLLILNEEPVAYDVKHLPYYRGRPIVEKEIQYATFPEMVAQKESAFAIKKELCISIEYSQPIIEKALYLKESRPMLVVDQRLFDQQNQPIGWGKTFYKSEYGKIKACSG